jgi:hypothetical protein
LSCYELAGIKLKKEPVRVTFAYIIGGALGDVGAVLQKMLTELTDFFLCHIVVAVGVKQNRKIFANDMRFTNTRCVVTVGWTRLAWRIMRTATLHFVVASALFPTFLHCNTLEQTSLFAHLTHTRCEFTAHIFGEGAAARGATPSPKYF